MKVKSEYEITQLYPTLGDPMDCSLPCSPVHGIFKARVLAWVAIDFSDVSKQIPLNIAYACACSVVSDSPRSQGLQPTRLLRPWDFPGKSTAYDLLN